MKMAPSCSQAFSVTQKKPELVLPAKPTPREIKHLSDIDDQEGLRFQVPFILFCRKNPSMEGKDPVKIIRNALAHMLVYYYPLAGRLIEGPNRKLLVNCTGEGVLFIEADANVSLDQLRDSIQPPCPYLGELLQDVPGSADILGCPLLLIQVTRLTCGGFVAAFRVNHPMTDALGMFHFLNGLGQIARGAPGPSQLPTWEREILSARDPPRITCAHHEYEEVTDPNNSTMASANLVHGSFFFGPKEISSIRKHLPPRLLACTTFEALIACLWKCRTIAMQVDPNDIVRISYLINVGGKRGIKLPAGYYGNAFAFPAALAKAEQLCKNPLSFAVDSVRKIKTQMSQEYIKSVADLMVIKGRPHYTTVRHLIVADNTRVPFGDVDFGWGKPVYAGVAGVVPNISCCVRFKNSEGEDGIVVQISLPPQEMDRFREEVAKMTGEPSRSAPNDRSPTRLKSML